MAFSPPVVGCLVKKGLQKGGGVTGTPGPQWLRPCITSKFDYCNSLLHGVPKHVIKQFQRVQNAAARDVILPPKPCHSTPVLASPHLLPIELRI